MIELVVTLTFIVAIVGFAVGIWRDRDPLVNEKAFDFEGSPNNDKSLEVHGCTKTEMETILTEFIELYSMESFSRNGISTQTHGQRHTIKFPKDLPAETFIWLVNFFTYPFCSIKIGKAIGFSTLGDEFSALGCPIAGVRAVFYVPDPDPGGDVVRVLTERSNCWDYTWDTKGGWASVEEHESYGDVAQANTT